MIAPASDSNFRAYAPNGPIALLPSAFGLSFPAATTVAAAPFELLAGGKSAVVCISGPLTLAGGPFFDTYDDIKRRIGAALESSAETVVMRINSPGGDVFGCFDCARALRQMAAAAGKKLVAYSEANMCSSAYALGCAASEIVISDTASIGSIGVIATAMDLTRQDAAMGIGIALVTSGTHKADQNPHTPFTDEMRAAMQVSVDAMASVFWEHVGASRNGALTAEGAQALQAGVAVGALAVSAGLADRLSSWGQLVGALATPESSAPSAILSSTMPNDDDKKDDEKKNEDAVRASLVTASTSDDPKKAARAKAALKAYDDGEDEKAAAPATPARASSDGEDDEKKALKATVSALSASVQALQAERKAESEAKALSERSAFLASRSDLTKEQLEAFAPLSLTQIKAIVATLPPPRTFANPYVARTESPAIQGSSESEHSAGSLEQNAYLDEVMGLNSYAPRAVVNDGTVQRFGVRKVAAAPSKA